MSVDIENYSNDCELVLALVAPVGVNLDDVINRLDSFISQYNYTMNLIHLSKIINEANSTDDEKQRLDQGMNKGNLLRDRHGRGDYLGLLALNEINTLRDKDKDVLKPLSRHVHVIRSLKHPDEVEMLRQVYGNGFFLLGFTASNESREKYLHDEKGIPSDDVAKLIERDDKEGLALGQRTSDVYHMADAFIASDAEDPDLSSQISRVFELLFSKPVISPTSDEYAMFMAYAASLRSADLSRQVGAVILNKRNDLIATGANDVPAPGGGLYWPNEDDQRDHILGKDINEEQRNDIILSVMKKAYPDKEYSNDEERLEEGKKLFKDTGILDITEYGRAVHAEMEAISSAARNGIKVHGSTLYTTTFPCHNCTKHIVAVGINKVKYIEPYPKSFASKLHSDSVTHDPNERQKLIFEPFIGIGPRKYVDLFSISLGSGRKLKRKENGILKNWNRKDAELRVPMTPLSYIDAETILINDIEFTPEDTNDENH